MIKASIEQKVDGNLCLESCRGCLCACVIPILTVALSVISRLVWHDLLLTLQSELCMYGRMIATSVWAVRSVC
jgi:hypothetical protein